MKILNLYSGIGGNRKIWPDNLDITAVEFDKNIAKFYAELFPRDRVIIADAHQFLLENFMNYDFIWASPPCQSHSSFRQNICVKYRGTPVVYPDMRLYQEIVFLRHNFHGLWAVENVIPYYSPLIKPTRKIGRHYFWSNFFIGDYSPKNQVKIRTSQIPELSKLTGFDLSKTELTNKRQILRNCVNSDTGLYVLNCAISHYFDHK